ncbi:MAG: 50S ribosomal protein L6 [Candidatus Andersenbacteria bacterium]
MSRLAKKPIAIPAGVTVTLADRLVTIKGPKGEIQRNFAGLGVKITKDKELHVEKTAHGDAARWGLAHALLRSMVTGTTTGFTKTLEVNGVGYRAAVAGKLLKLELGFSHEVAVPLPEGIAAKVQKNQIILTGHNAEQLGTFAATVRALRPPEPYKGKGIRYLGEYVRQKEGKKAAGEAAGGAG